MEKKIIYTNQIQLAMQPMDFTLSLNMVGVDGAVENQANVYISPQHAKSLLIALAENVRMYEELFGSINLEPNSDKIKELQEKGAIQVLAGVRQ
ncbi:DUF3467 domain-containing protein [Cohnella fermenti]|uniref:DUF3467 domain-containing protein n=1 Tax=Cohnella fermenti TaxID=2565925 RepID=A0A4S4C8P9_9BACL|nr:DUF3467 domain-containing protein [Cohnella fermenti]THF83730.1 DUF3467 domain-containing protein [Cohnella fermenti]